MGNCVPRVLGSGHMRVFISRRAQCSAINQYNGRQCGAEEDSFLYQKSRGFCHHHGWLRLQEECAKVSVVKESLKTINGHVCCIVIWADTRDFFCWGPIIRANLRVTP